jgi:NAD(P)-dependent dehydrogenase (short-subunit alcohol dehydrogenase family)
MKEPGNVLITGGASGLGRATALAVADAGGRPFVLDRQPSAEFEHVTVDLADVQATKEAVAKAIAELGSLDAVFTAAAMDHCGPLEHVPSAEWQQVINVNLVATAIVAQACIPALRESGGRIITCASTLGLRAVGDASAYCASKFGVIGFTRSLATELGSAVGVTLLIPGGMKTAFFDGRTEQYLPPAGADLQDPADVAQAVLSVLRQPLSSQIRELVVVSGGELSWP